MEGIYGMSGGAGGRLGLLLRLTLIGAQAHWLGLVAAFAIFTSAPVTAQVPSSIRICTPEWEGYSMSDGSGLYHQLWNKVFAANGVGLEFTYAPYKRCQTLVERGEADAVPGGYGSEGDGYIFPKWHIGIDILSVAYPSDTIDQWSGQSDLDGKRVGWQRGYAFDEAGTITANVTLEEFDDLENVLRKLALKRLDFVVDYSDQISEAIEKYELSDDLDFAADVINGPKYFMSFTNNERGESFAGLWDREMQRLNDNGDLKVLYEAIGDPGY